MRLHLFLLYTIIACAFMFSSCGISSEQKLSDTADSFSVAYFNWQFSKALTYADNDSYKWLSYMASQVSQEDVDSLRAMQKGAKVTVKEVAFYDSAAMVTVEVNEFLAMDSINKSPKIIPKATFRIPVRQENGTWKVALRGIIR